MKIIRIIQATPGKYHSWWVNAAHDECCRKKGEEMYIHLKNVSRGMLIALIMLLCAAGAVIAQQKMAASDTGIFEPSLAAGSSDHPYGAGKVQPNGTPQPPTTTDSASFNSITPGNQGSLALEDIPARGTSSFSNTGPSALSPMLSYYMVSGATLRGRGSSVTYAYDAVGCVHLTSGATSLTLTSDLHLPAGSMIKFIRLYYRDYSATEYVGAYLARYMPGVATTDQKVISSDLAFAGGTGFVDSAELSVTVDNANYAYALLGFTSVADANLQICGIRVAYLAPISTLVYLPQITR
jgi:hypothetical protein